VITVMVGVENEVQFAGIQLLDRGFNLRRQRRKLIIDDQQPIVPHRHPDVPTFPLQHVNVPSHMNDLDFDFRPVALLGEGEERHQDHRCHGRED